MARIRLTPQKREFFDLFTQASANAQEIARLLVDLLNGWPDSRERLADIRELEHEGDRLTHEVINLLNRTFVTPLDRDDMYRLATAIDDVCDHIDEAADNIDLYEVRDVPARAQEQADVVYRIYQMEPAGGFASQATAGFVIFASTRAGYPLSTTHVISGAVIGSGATKRLSAVRWGVAGNIVFAWVLTIPAAAVMAAGFYYVGTQLG